MLFLAYCFSKSYIHFLFHQFNTYFQLSRADSNMDNVKVVKHFYYLFWCFSLDIAFKYLPGSGAHPGVSLDFLEILTDHPEFNVLITELRLEKGLESSFTSCKRQEDKSQYGQFYGHSQSINICRGKVLFLCHHAYLYLYNVL